MRGIAHFAAGVAVASCVPETVRAAMAGNGLYFILGGVAGLLPDVLDAKLNRFIFRPDVEIIPDPHAPDPQLIADGIAAAYNRSVYVGRPIRIRLNAIPVAVNRWQRYELYFDVMKQAVHVRYGPLIDDDQRVVEPAPRVRAGTAKLQAPVKLDYQARIQVDNPDGASFELQPTPAGDVIPLYAPWRRAWSHSLVLAFVFALAIAAATNVTAGIVAFGAWTAHTALDHLGFSGTTLFYPFSKRRTPGLGVVDPTETRANLLAVWTCTLVVFWNAYRATPELPSSLSVIQFIFYSLLVPLFLTALLRHAPGEQT